MIPGDLKNNIKRKTHIHTCKSEHHININLLCIT